MVDGTRLFRRVGVGQKIVYQKYCQFRLVILDLSNIPPNEPALKYRCMIYRRCLWIEYCGIRRYTGSVLSTLHLEVVACRQIRDFLQFLPRTLSLEEGGLTLQLEKVHVNFVLTNCQIHQSSLQELFICLYQYKRFLVVAQQMRANWGLSRHVCRHESRQIFVFFK